MESAKDYWTAHALLEWQVEMEADEAILDAPLNRYELVDEKPTAKVSPLGKAAPPPVPMPTLKPAASQRPSIFGTGPISGKPSGVKHIGPLLAILIPASAKSGIRFISRSRCGINRSRFGGSNSSMKFGGMPSSAQNSGSF